MTDHITTKGVCYVAKEAVIKGDVTMGENVSVWYNATVRGDAYPIVIGDGTNVQDNAVLHVGEGYSLTIGNNVTIGHGAIVHGCEVGDDTIIGMGAIILNGAKVGRRCIIGAGALVTQGTVIPDGAMAFGNPAKVFRMLSEEEQQKTCYNAIVYVDEAKGQLPVYTG